MKDFKVLENEDEEFAKDVKYNLHLYNMENCSYIKDNSSMYHINKVKRNFAVYDGDKVIGGAVGYCSLAWYYLDDLWLDASYRHQGVGTRLIKEIEKFAKIQNCLGIRTETWRFQARDFYEKLGFHVYASFDDFPPGSTEYYLVKRF